MGAARLLNIIFEMYEKNIISTESVSIKFEM